ncbi:TetR/AcrR family transcriptional regulator [Klebsiella michiganensis]|uniref:TetR/AcrR family transcriptional regulator n=1 Tax=Klebsiella michiganensis TaxID=1134687 RepID=UPI0032DB9E8D
MLQKGYMACTIKEICKVRSVAVSEFHLCFHSKEALGEIIILRFFERVLFDIKKTFRLGRKSAETEITEYWHRTELHTTATSSQSAYFLTILLCERVILPDIVREAFNDGCFRLIDCLKDEISHCLSDSLHAHLIHPEACRDAAWLLLQSWSGTSLITAAFQGDFCCDRAIETVRLMLLTNNQHDC